MTDVPAPGVRGRVAQDALRLLDEFEPDATARARARIPAGSLEVIDRTAALGWVPIEHDHHIPAAIVATLGPRADAYFGGLVDRQLNTPLLRSTLTATRRLLGLSPAALVRAVPLAWPVVYRDFGSVKVLPQRGHRARLAMSREVPEVFEHDAYITSFRSFFGGFFTMCETQGVVEVEAAPQAARIDFTLTW